MFLWQQETYRFFPSVWGVAVYELSIKSRNAFLYQVCLYYQMQYPRAVEYTDSFFAEG